MAVTKNQVQKLIGQHVDVVRKDGSRVSGKLLRISGNQLVFEKESGKKVQTKALIPLVLFDLLAIGLTQQQPYGYGSPYGGCGGNGGCGGYGYGNPYGGYY